MVPPDQCLRGKAGHSRGALHHFLRPAGDHRRDGDCERFHPYLRQFLFRIEKGILDINDNAVNDHFAEGELRIPFRNIVYIGDSATDIPCMRLVNSLGGHSVGVYDSENTASKDTVRRMIRDERIRYYVPADYTKGCEMDTLMHRIIDKTAAYEVLEEKHLRDRKEAMAKY